MDGKSTRKVKKGKNSAGKNNSILYLAAMRCSLSDVAAKFPKISSFLFDFVASYQKNRNDKKSGGGKINISKLTAYQYENQIV